MFYFPYGKLKLKAWCQNWNTEITTIGTQLNEPAADIAASQTNATAIINAINDVEAARAALERLILTMNTVIKNDGGALRDFVSRIKTNGLYTEDHGQVLGTVSTKESTDLTNAQPVLTIKTTGGYNHISFQKHGADGINIYTAQQGDASFKLLVNAKETPYVDIRQLAAGTTQEFYGMYTFKNTEVGLRSATISIKIAG